MNTLSLTVGEVAERVGGRLVGDADVPVRRLVGLRDAGAEDLTFAVDARRAAALGDSGAAAALVPAEQADLGIPQIVVEDVQRAVATLLSEMDEPSDLPPDGADASALVSPDAEVDPSAGVGPGAVISAGARIATGARICARAFIGAGVEVGVGSFVFEGAVVRAGCRVGARCRIGPNSVIGHDGFGYDTREGVHNRIPHVEAVEIADDVEIGAGVCIDRGKFVPTRIGAGAKIDNLVQIGHNVQVGRGCLLCGQVGVAGSTRLGDYVVLGGGSGVKDNITIGDGVQCAAYAAIAQDAPPGERLAGVPAVSARDKLRQIKAVERLPELLKKIKELEARLSELESPTHD